VTAARWVALAALVVGAAAAGLLIGAVPVAPGDVVQALLAGGDGAAAAIVRELRAPRVALGLVVGAALATSGATLQGVLRNPLAEPYLLGVSGGAAVGATVAAALGASADTLTVAALLGALAAVAVVLLVARLAGGGADPRVLLMAGVVVGAFANAVIMVALANAPANAVRGALWWMMGSLADARWGDVARVAGALVLAGGVLVARARDVDALALGEDAAAALGVDVERAARWSFAAAAALAAVTVAAAGLIGFVGLIVPALARALGARRARAVGVAAALLGAALVTGADVVARTVAAPAELPLGALTALAGVPFFLARLRARP
jgi:iron complex transport system permease protein